MYKASELEAVSLDGDRKEVEYDDIAYAVDLSRGKAQRITFPFGLFNLTVGAIVKIVDKEFPDVAADDLRLMSCVGDFSDFVIQQR